MRKHFATLALVLPLSFSALMSADAPAQDTAGTTVLSPFDKEDPEIRRIHDLKWKELNFSDLDDRHRMAAYFAMNKGLSIMGSKADARLDLLVDFIEANKLGEAMAEASATIPPPPAISFADYEKMGAAFVKSPDGSVKLEDEMGDIPDSMVPAYTRLYQNSARRAFEEVLESRHQVRLMAVFLEKQGKLEEFKKWSADEKRRRQEAYVKEQAEKRAKAAADEAARREQAIAAAKEKQKQEAELAARRMEYAMQMQAQQQNAPTQVVYDHDHYWNDPWYPWTGAYYANSYYRSQVRDRVQNAWQRWGSKPRPRPLPSRR